MFGWGYVKDFCISLFKKEQQEKAIKLYYGECLRMIAKNTAQFVGGAYIEAHLSDILEPKPVDNRPADDIISVIKEKINSL